MFRTRSLDGALHAFDPVTGLNAHIAGPATRDRRASAPRSVQISVTNHCNLTCSFCYRDTSAPSEWTVDGLVTLLRDLDRAGVDEVAFGGGEPFAFKGFVELLRRLRDETSLAVNVTTNGLLADPAAIDGAYAELRLSLYDDVMVVDRFVAAGLRFGVNLLVTPSRLPVLTELVLDLCARGVRDVLLLSYNGPDDLHLSPDERRDLEAQVCALSRALSGRCSLKLSVCFGDRLRSVPRVRPVDDCGAGTDFVAIGSDRTVRACSFHHDAAPIESAEDVLRVYRDRRRMARAAKVKGCARTEGLVTLRRRAPERTEVRLYRAHGSNNSGSYTLVGAVPSHELAVSTVEEILAVSEAQATWLRDEARKEPSPLDRFVSDHALTRREVGEDDWPDHGKVEALAVGHQVIVYVDWTVSMPPFFGELLYRRGGRVAFEQVHAHAPTIVEGMIWRPGMWQRTARVESDAIFAKIDAELRALLPGLMMELRKGVSLEAAHRTLEGPGIAFTAIFRDLVKGVSEVNALVERHGGKLQVRLTAPPVEGASDPLEAYRKRGRGHGRHQVVLWRVGDDRVGVMKVVRDGIAIGLDEVRSRIDQLPWIVSDGLSVEDARALAQALRDAGADATVALV